MPSVKLDILADCVADFFELGAPGARIITHLFGVFGDQAKKKALIQ